jgi:hypothetical protein
MKHNSPIFSQDDRSSSIPGPDMDPSRIRTVATRDHQAIRLWAARHGAEPATGIATASGPSTLSVNDGGAVVRFNFPGTAKFRPIEWDEWFAIFDAERLLFVYEEERDDRAHEIWMAKGGTDGHALDDWLEAERTLGLQPGQRYRFIRTDD